MTTRFASVCGCSFALLALSLQVGCKDEELPPFAGRGNPSDAGTEDGGTAGTGAVVKVNQAMVDKLREWGADVEDPDKVCSAEDYSCGINQKGIAKCWGDVAAYQPPADLPPLVQISCALVHVCALADDGTIHCWGHGSDETMVRSDEFLLNYGQAIVPQGKYKEVSARGFHTCAITENDTVACWGAGGPDTFDLKPDFGQARPPIGRFRDISAGTAHTCAISLDSNGVECWGASANVDAPAGCFPPESFSCGQASPPSGAFRQITSGELHACGIREDYSIECWGAGQSVGVCLLEGTSAEIGFECGQGVPPDDVADPFLRVRAGFYFTCGITDQYWLYCWGLNEMGETVPPPGRHFAQVAEGGGRHACGIQTDGYFNCWGGAPKTLIPAELNPE